MDWLDLLAVQGALKSLLQCCRTRMSYWNFPVYPTHLWASSHAVPSACTETLHSPSSPSSRRHPALLEGHFEPGLPTRLSPAESTSPWLTPPWLPWPPSVLDTKPSPFLPQGSCPCCPLGLEGPFTVLAPPCHSGHSCNVTTSGVTRVPFAPVWPRPPSGHLSPRR